jgi:RNA polymerase sigma factor (sigma-70 family)
VITRRRDGAILRQLQTLYNIGTIGDLTDGQLLERFATDADEVAELAFAALVERHEAMVWRVCLAIVGNEHEAEDAFQATFLVLVRKARSLWVQDSLGPWLHQVACRTASCLRAARVRRRRHEQCRALRDGPPCSEIARLRDPDLDTAIHEEVNRLPEKYRAPIVLCDLEGYTHQEAARFLGWPIGTVKSRQSLGRRLVRERLVRRGVGLAVAAAVAESLRESAIAAMPKEVARSTVNAAIHQSVRLLTGVSVSAQVLTLTRGVIRAMFWINLRSLVVATLAVAM